MLSTDTTPTRAPDTWLGVAIRIAFFVGFVVICLPVFQMVISNVFGLVVSATVGVFASGLVANLLVMRIFDRRPLTDVGLAINKRSGINLLVGILLAGGTAALMLVAPLIAGAGHLILRTNPMFSSTSLLFYLFALLFGAMGEEMLFRGYAFQLLVEKVGPITTVLLVGALFGLGHMLNPHASLIGVINTMLWGILLGFAFLRSHDLWLPIGLHYGWNSVLPLFGVNLSGLTIEVTRYFYKWDLTPLWSGGDYGPEGGLLATAFVGALFWTLARIPIRAQHSAIAPSINEPDFDAA